MSRIVTFFFFVRNGLKGEKCRGKIPPGAFGRQKSGKPIPPWLIEPGHMSQYPEADVNTCYIDAIVDLKTGKTYVGRTINNSYVGFVEHRKYGDPLGKATLMDDSKFGVLECLRKYVSKNFTCLPLKKVNCLPIKFLVCLR